LRKTISAALPLAQKRGTTAFRQMTAAGFDGADDAFRRFPCSSSRKMEGWEELVAMSTNAHPTCVMLLAALAAFLAGADAVALHVGTDQLNLSRRQVSAPTDVNAAAYRQANQAAAVPPVIGFASVRGSVVDRFGGPLSGADVVLVNDASGERRSAKTAADATFEFGNLPSGSYSVEVSRDGFAPAYRNVMLKDDETSMQTLTMQVGNLEETLRVVAGREPAPGGDGNARRPAVRPSESSRDRVCSADGSGCVTPARKLSDLRPQYPASASERGLEGVVVVDAVIDDQGTVGDVRVQRSADEQLDAAVVEAVRQWQFVPTMLNGSPTPSMLTVTVEFAIAAR
jgi:TonB family protein